MDVNSNDIENLLARSTTNVWFNDHFEENKINIDETN